MEPLVKRKIDRLCRVKGSGHYCLTVVAKASLPWAGGRYMAVVIDGRSWIGRIVTSRDLKTFTSPLRVSAGVHRIAIQFSNGLLMKNGDCSLYLK